MGVTGAGTRLCPQPQESNSPFLQELPQHPDLPPPPPAVIQAPGLAVRGGHRTTASPSCKPWGQSGPQGATSGPSLAAAPVGEVSPLLLPAPSPGSAPAGRAQPRKGAKSRRCRTSPPWPGRVWGAGTLLATPRDKRGHTHKLSLSPSATSEPGSREIAAGLSGAAGGSQSPGEGRAEGWLTVCTPGRARRPGRGGAGGVGRQDRAGTSAWRGHGTAPRHGAAACGRGFMQRVINEPRRRGG